jgi:hypothetical protein
MDTEQDRLNLKLFTDWCEHYFDMSNETHRTLVQDLCFLRDSDSPDAYIRHSNAVNTIHSIYPGQLPFLTENMQIVSRVALKQLLKQLLSF